MGLKSVKIVSSLFVQSHPQNSKPLTEGPAAQEVNLKLMVEDDDRLLFSIQKMACWVGVECAFSARPPLQDCNYLCRMKFNENIILSQGKGQILTKNRKSTHD